MAESLAPTEVPLVGDFSTYSPNPAFADARVGVVTFPGTLDDRDAARAVRLAGGTVVELWHDDADLKNVDAVIIPGGFSYGDYLRAGAIAAKAPVMRSMIKNDHRKFICRDQVLRIENNSTSWTSNYAAGQEIVVPLKNQDGQYVADPKTLEALEAEGRVVFRYVGFNPNGSRNDIAGISNERGNVVGLMPHPEHAVEPGFGPSSSGFGEVSLRGGADGLGVFTSVLANLINAR